MKVGTEESQGQIQKEKKKKSQTHQKTCIGLPGLSNRELQTGWLYTTEIYVSPFWKIEI